VFRRALPYGVAAAFVAVALVLGMNYGIRIGVEETTEFYWLNAPVCKPSVPYEPPIPTG
jgi:hypothetical protein